MSTSAIKAGEAFIEFFARDETKATFDKIGGRMKSFGAVVTGIGASLTAAGLAALGGIAPAINSFADFGGAITDAASRTALSTTLLQSLSFSAEQAGGSIKDIESAARTMNKTIAAAANGNKTATKSLDALGMSAADLLALDPDERFKALAEGVSRINDPSLRAAAAMKVFGKSATNIMETLSGGADEINRTTQELEGAGLILSKQDIDNADALGDAWGQLTATLSRAYQLIGAALAPTLTDLITTGQSWVTWLTQVANSNREWIVLLAKLAAGAIAVGVVLTTVGGVIFGIGMVVAAIPAIVAAVTAAVGFLSAAFALLISPLGLAVAAITSMVALMPVLAYVLDANFFDGAGLKTIIGLFSEMLSVAKQTISGIFDAIATGNWQLAGRIAMGGLVVAFTIGWGWIKTGFGDLVTYLSKLFIDFFGDELIGIVANGLKWVIDLINKGSEAIGTGKVIGTEGIEQLAKSAENGTLKTDLDRQNKIRREAIDRDIADAKKGLKVMTDLAAQEKDKRFGSKDSNQRGFDPAKVQTPSQAFQQIQSTGATSSAAVARLAYTQPVFDKIEKHLETQTGLLEDIADNTEDIDEGGLSD